MNEPSTRSAATIAYLELLFSGKITEPKHLDIAALDEAALLRIQAAVLDIEVNARNKIMGYFATMVDGPEAWASLEETLNSDKDNMAKWLTTRMFREHIGFPIFELVARECVEILPRDEMLAGLEAAAQFAYGQKIHATRPW